MCLDGIYILFTVPDKLEIWNTNFDTTIYAVNFESNKLMNNIPNGLVEDIHVRFDFLED